MCIDYVSLATLQNAFIERLGCDFDLSRMLVIDFMHEVELGVWKALFAHLIRILYAGASSGTLVAELDKRYRYKITMNQPRRNSYVIGFAKFPHLARQSAGSPTMYQK
jgi:hypothetical protein